MPQALYFSDSFTGTTGAAWSGSWLNAVSDTGASATIQTNRGRQNAGTLTSGQRVDRYSGTNQVDVEFSGTFIVNTSSTSAGIEIWIRGDDATNNGNGYFLVMNLGAKPTLSKGAGFTYPSITSLSTAPTLAQSTQYGWRLYAVGSTIRAKVWAVTGGEPALYSATVTDTTHSTAGQCWVRLGNGGGTASQTIDWDDVTLTDGATSFQRPLQQPPRQTISPVLFGQRLVFADPNQSAAAGIPGPIPVQPWRRDPVQPQQPQRETDPAVLATALLENELLGSADDVARHRTWFTDRRLYPRQLQTFAVDLTTAQVEGPLLGGADDQQRHRTWYTDRRLYPAQLATWDVDLTTALLEGPALGAATTAARALVPVTHAPRWWMPQQPARAGSTPGLLDTAVLEGPLLHVDQVHGTWWPRPWFGLQRPALADQSSAPPPPDLDPTLSGWLPRWLAGTQSVYLDRRQVPQQRAALVDQSSPPPVFFDPTAAGTGRLVTLTASVQRAPAWPQQRQLESDPLMLLTALLEVPAPDLRHGTWFTRPGWTQPARALQVPVVDVPGPVDVLRQSPAVRPAAWPVALLLRAPAGPPVAVSLVAARPVQLLPRGVGWLVQCYLPRALVNQGVPATFAAISAGWAGAPSAAAGLAGAPEVTSYTAAAPAVGPGAAMGPTVTAYPGGAPSVSGG